METLNSYGEEVWLHQMHLEILCLNCEWLTVHHQEAVEQGGLETDVPVDGIVMGEEVAEVEVVQADVTPTLTSSWGIRT